MALLSADFKVYVCEGQQKSSPYSFYVVVFPLKPRSDSSDLSVLSFIEMYCWKCTGQEVSACPSKIFSLSVVRSLHPLSLQSHRSGRGFLLFYLLVVRCVCSLVCAHAYAGEAADAGDDDQSDE